ncbi:hypothetical protein LRM31_22695 [Enterobacter kobei]|uniref:hypothetical protein n=1 Tax=Enterobacter kobei TaxID=208224 RepID=UPI00063B00A6|nr:hypothetical protein [Enterobacter kobei]AYL03922.1 hypothetical protein D9T11_03595 [Enterobacter kobei]ELN2576889.1 hypothetical protein [Enterobacter kobei]KLG24307.1 hypothetical protein YA50_13885 [Enterobacter kobei]MCF1289507.1 hypothetical protein [Enterobacter kobei]MCK6815786.1 hypothetical protein [Enterobacter kobei]
MKIRDHRDPLGRVVDVFSVYWFGDETYFLGFLKGYGGLMSYRANQVTIINPEINFNCIYFKESIHHWALIKEKLLDDLLELDEIAYKRFLEIVKAEGLVDPDFY